VNRDDTLTILSTGGTFNKIYNPLTGALEIDPEARALRQIMERWRCRFELRTLIHKDSLEMDDRDRRQLAQAVAECPGAKILIVHGTDTMEHSARYLTERFGSERQILLTGAMVPYSIDPVEATANLASAVGWMKGSERRGVFLALHGLILPEGAIYKDREAGYFRPRLHKGEKG